MLVSIECKFLFLSRTRIAHSLRNHSCIRVCRCFALFFRTAAVLFELALDFVAHPNCPSLCPLHFEWFGRKKLITTLWPAEDIFLRLSAEHFRLSRQFPTNTSLTKIIFTRIHLGTSRVVHICHWSSCCWHSAKLQRLHVYIYMYVHIHIHMHVIYLHLYLQTWARFSKTSRPHK